MKRLLTPAENALWRRAMRGVSPVTRKDAPLMGESQEALAETSKLRSIPRPSRRRLAAAPRDEERESKEGTGPRWSLSPGAPLARHGGGGERKQTSSPDPFGAGDPREDRRVASGKSPIEGRLDLHGLRQGAARSALLRFLIKARAEGRRCVLVITGKGARPSSHGLGARGVLRTRFYDWLREDAFRPHVARAAQAHERHGGEGAFYVFLKAPASGRRRK
jgi:DNA-nicking Smr family endonuclease